MRNEIFARYGYIFTEPNEMDMYFNDKYWYNPVYNNVDAFLTPIEKYNIKISQKYEKD